MDQSPAAFFCAADETDNGYRGATGFRGFGDFSVDFLLLTGYGGGGENLLPTCVLCHVSRCRTDKPRHQPGGVNAGPDESEGSMGTPIEVWGKEYKCSSAVVRPRCDAVGRNVTSACPSSR